MTRSGTRSSGCTRAIGEIQQVLRAGGYQTAKEVGAWAKMVGYITVPWRDEYGQPATLYGRWPAKAPPEGQEKTYALPGAGSKASPLFFDRVRKAHLTDVVMVEGLLDVMLGRALGDNRLVAYVAGQPPLAQHLVLAKHGVKVVTICSDPDKGGEGGILSFIRNADPSVRTYVAPKLPNGMDPDEFMLDRGIDAWRRHIDQAEPGYIWRARHILGKHRLDSAKGRDDARVELAGYASTVEDHERDEIAAVAAGPLAWMPGRSVVTSVSPRPARTATARARQSLHQARLMRRRRSRHAARLSRCRRRQP